MHCTKCGAALDASVAFCPGCGTPAQQPVYQQPTYQQPTYQQPTYQQPAYQQPVYQNPNLNQQAQMPMKWFKFLIYFSLFAGALLNLISGIQMLNGAIYDGDAELVYAVFDDLEMLDKAVGILMVLTAVLGVYTRFRLSGYCANGPKLLSVVYLAAVLVNVIYLAGVYSILPEVYVENLDLSSFISSCVTSVVMVFINQAYFKKRAHLFVN